MSNVIIVLAIVVYLAMMLYIGFIMSNKNKNTDDFYLGGRKLGPLVTAMSAEASDMSSWLLMGLPQMPLGRQSALPSAPISTGCSWRAASACTPTPPIPSRFRTSSRIATVTKSTFFLPLPLSSSSFSSSRTPLPALLPAASCLTSCSV